MKKRITALTTLIPLVMIAICILAFAVKWVAIGFLVKLGITMF